MELKSKFSIGETVYRAGTTRSQQMLPCPDCLGEGRWTVVSPAGDKFDFACPRCKDRNHDLSYWIHTPSVTKLTVGSVRIDTASKDKPIEYMCKETGVGSGSLYAEADFFATEEQAYEAAQIKAQAYTAADPELIKRYNKSLSLHTYQLSGKQSMEHLASANFCPSPTEREAWEFLSEEIPWDPTNVICQKPTKKWLRKYQDALTTLQRTFTRNFYSAESDNFPEPSQ